MVQKTMSWRAAHRAATPTPLWPEVQVCAHWTEEGGTSWTSYLKPSGEKPQEASFSAKAAFGPCGKFEPGGKFAKLNPGSFPGQRVPPGRVGGRCTAERGGAVTSLCAFSEI